MVRRRSRVTSSSLDLFLDTICNAFGGIMFLSILIAVLLQFRGNQSDVVVDQPTISEEESQRISNRMTQLQSERQQLEAIIASLEKSMVGEEQTQILELQAQLDQTKKQQEQSVKEQVDRSQQLSDLQTQIREQRKELVELDQRLIEARASLVEKSNAVDEALDSREQKTELPKVRSTSKGNLLCLMRYGKLYLVTDVANSSTDFYAPHVIVKTLPGITRVKPRPDSGWDLSSPADVTEFEGTIAGSASSGTFFSCAVWPDSFEQFGAFKDVLIRQGYEYQLIPVDDVDDLPIGRGSDAQVQ
jgi:hypothetical protein